MTREMAGGPTALTPGELVAIADFIRKLESKTVDERHRLYYEWARTGKLSRRQHTLLGIHLFSAK